MLSITAGPENPVWGMIYLFEFNSPLDDPTEFQGPCLPGSALESCPPDPFQQPACADINDPSSLVGSF